VLACHEEYCSAGVAEVLGADLGQLRHFRVRPEVAAEHVGAAHGGTCESREDEIVVFPERVGRESLRSDGSGRTSRATLILWEHFTEWPSSFLGFSGLCPVALPWTVMLRFSLDRAGEVGHAGLP
jgi:hypothetical protein